MSITTSISRDPANELFTNNPSIIDLGLNLNPNISAVATGCKGVSPEHLTKASYGALILNGSCKENVENYYIIKET